MKQLTFGVLLTLSTVVGCGGSRQDTLVTQPITPEQTSATESTGLVDDHSSLPAGGTRVTLDSSNTKIAFVGTHAGKDPDPDARHGEFSDFVGVAVLDDDVLQEIGVEIQTASISTAQDKLTNHLKSADFFDVRNFPQAKFQSTRIVRDEEGDYEIHGELTLLETTKEVSFGARVGQAGGELQLSAKFTIDRHEFEMDKVPHVSPTVSLVVTVGRSDTGAEGDPARRPEPTQQARRGRGNFDPVARFKELDADGDGELRGDEIPERMRERLADVDTDSSDSVSLAEMEAMFARFRGGRRGGRRGGDGGGGGRRGGDGSRGGGGDRPGAGGPGSRDGGERPQRPE